MIRSVLVSLAPLLLCGPLLRAQTQPPAVIVASGTGRVALAPDHATMNIAIETHAATAAAASTLNAQKQASVLAALRGLGYSDENAKAVGFSVSPNIDYSDSGRRLIDYESRIDIAVAVAKLEQLGPTMDAALEAGGTEIRNIEFISDSAAVGRRQALKQALDAARGDAQALALAAGGRLGRLLEVSTLPPLMGPGSGLALMPGVVSSGYARVAPSDVTLDVTVYTRWELRLTR